VKWAVESWQRSPDRSRHNSRSASSRLNRFETYFLNTVGDAAAFCDEVGHPAIGLLVDTFHANIERRHWPGSENCVLRT